MNPLTPSSGSDDGIAASPRSFEPAPPPPPGGKQPKPPRSSAAKRYVVDTIIGPCEQWEAEDLAEAIMQLRQFSNVGGGAVSLTVFEEDE